MWLLAYARHRSGAADDFFPYCKTLDAEDRLLPTEEDYQRLFEDRARRFVHAVRVEAPLVLREARDSTGEIRRMLGGEFGVCVAVEAADDLEEITVAFRVASVEWGLVSVVLAAFQPGRELAARLPTRVLEPDEVAFSLLGGTL